MQYRKHVLAVVMLIFGGSGALAQDCQLIEHAAVEAAMHDISRDIFGAEKPAPETIMGKNAVIAVDAYLPSHDQFMPKVYRGPQGLDEFRTLEIPSKWQVFSIASVFSRPACETALAVGRFTIYAGDEYRPWFYSAILFKAEGRLWLGSLRLSTPIPRKRYSTEQGESLACTDQKPSDSLDMLREKFVAAIQSGEEQKLADLFPPIAPFSFFEPTVSERVEGVDQIVLARAATAIFFKGKTVEDLPDERMAYQFCSNLSYGGVLKVSSADAAPLYVGYRNHASVRDDDNIGTSQIYLTLLNSDIANNLPEDINPMFAEEAEKIRGWITR